MEPRKFRGYAQASGFNPIQAPDGVSKIAREGDRILRGMRDVQQQLASNQGNFISGLERKFNLEEQNRNELFRFQEEQRKRIRDDELRNLERQSDIDPGSSTYNLKALATFSKTVSDLVVGQAKAQAERQMEEGLQLGYLMGLPTDEMEKFDQAEQQLQASHEGIQAVADKAQASGQPYEAVQQLRNLSGWKKYGAALAFVQRAGNSFGPWLDYQLKTNNTTVVQVGDQTFTPIDAKTPQQKAAAAATLRMEFMRRNDLTGLNPALLNKYLFPSVYQSEQKILADHREQFIKEEQQNAQDETLSNFSTAPNKSQLFWTTISDLERSGLSRREARQKAWEAIDNLDDLDAVGGAVSWDGKTLTRDKYKPEYIKARRRILETQKQDEDLKDSLLDQELENWTEPFLQELAAKPYDEKVYEQIKEQSRLKFFGKVDPRLERLQENNSLQVRERKFQDEQLWTLYGNNELTVDELRSGKYSPKVVADWMRKAEEQDKMRAPEVKSARGPGEAAVVNELKRRANLMQAGSTPHWSFELTKAHALRQLDAKAKVYLSGPNGMSPDEAYSRAAQDIVAQIDRDNPRDGKQGFGVYSVDKGASSGQGAFIRYTSGGSGGKGGLSQAKSDVSLIRSQVRSGGRAAVYSRPLISRSVAEQLVNPDSPVPPIISIIQNALPNGKEMSEFEIIDAQLNVHKLPKRQRPYVQQVVETTLPPRLQSLLYRTPDAFRTRRALTEGGVVGPGQERQAVQFIAQQLGVDPVDVATFINYETGGDLVSGKYRRGLDRWGGDGGRYFGWIQFSPDNQRKYGVRPGMSSMEMAQAVVKYMKNAGVRPGDTLDMLYQAVQAPAFMGRARAKGRNIGADSNGSISGHVARMRKEHASAASRWLFEGATSTGQTVYRDPRLLSAPARRLLSQWQMTSGFGAQESFRARPHEGNDYATPIGTKLSFKQPGVVLEAKPGTNDRSSNGGYGGYMDVHLADGNIVRIAHLSEVRVRKGQRLRAREIAALTGNTGRSTGAHAHIEHLSGPTGTQETMRGKRNPSWIASQIYADI